MSTIENIPSYKEGLLELRSNLKSMLPQDAITAFDNDAQLLEQEYQSSLKLNTGDKAKDFTLLNAVGEKVNLSELLKLGKVVLTFYRGSWCPYCNLQLQQYQQILPKIKLYGAQLVAISPQSHDESLNLKGKNKLDFEVLSDNGNIVARNYTKVFKNGDAPVNKMKELGLDFDSFYSDDSRELPVPAVFIIDQDGIITFAKSFGGDYRNRVEPEEILNRLKNRS